MTEITQADRDAAESILWVQTTIDDTNAIAGTFARHREQAEAETVAKTVAWLRGGAGIGASLAHASVLRAIEAGEYK